MAAPWRRAVKPEPDAETLAPNALVASAARLDMTRKPRGAIQQDWQEEAWKFYDSCGELRYAAQWMGNSLSRATIYAADVQEDGTPSSTPTENAGALGAAHNLLGGPTSQAGILSQIGVHLTIAGDCYVIGETPVDAAGDPLPDDDWYVASTDELFYQSGWWIDRGNGKRLLDPTRTVIIRVWQSHPRKRWQADSPTRAVLPILRELEALVRVAGTQMDSRLAGAGLLILPMEVQFPAPSQEALDANPGADHLMLSLAENTLTSLTDPEDSSRLVPTVLRVPGDLVEKVQHISFASQLQKENQEAREACIRRLALGLDMPPEQLLGMGGINHWGVWGVEEAGVKLHIVPRLTTIISAVNEAYYEPALEKLGLAPYAFTLWYDVSQLTQRPNRSQDALALHKAGQLSDDALRAATGFGDTDAPSQEQLVTTYLMTLAAAQPALGPACLPALLHLWNGGSVTTMPVLVFPANGGAPATTVTPLPAPAPAEDRGTPSTAPDTSASAHVRRAA